MRDIMEKSFSENTSTTTFPFAKWKNLFYKWENWLSNNKLDSVEACLNFAFQTKEIDKFVIRANHSWISRDRLYQRPEDGGLGAIHIETHAIALRCAWAKRATKVNDPKNICFISEADIHPMHKGIKMICRAFESLHKSYRDGNQETFHTPYKYLEVIKTNGPRGGET